MKMPHIPFTSYSAKDLALDRISGDLVEKLYRTNHSIAQACDEMGVEFDEDMLEDLCQCTHCNVWWYAYELVQDADGNDLCKFCKVYYDF